ncbi:EF-hand calcium-binding domain-containing protein 5-like isoform X2 [Amphiura filiformis]|uniref:EF-hand calcium-binding domain-containing protein 5-like isoform X2 n=1 Tax=Amphiura filiformis TaxID=82378 RepID=UPI003B21358D
MMANVQAVSPIGQLPGSGGIGRRSSAPRSQYGSPTHYGSRPNSRVSFSDGSGKPHSRQNSGGRLPRPPSQPRGSPDGSSGRERPPSVRSLHEKVEMSEFLSPAVKTAVRRWKRFHEEKVRERFKERRQSKKLYVQTVKIEKKKLARKIPIDVLALEWMNDNKVTVDARAYLLEKLLPTLILGVEKLLMEVDKRNLAEEMEVNPNFNPINYLAQYLMRNNPKYSNFPEASPYIRGLREVTDEIKNHVFSFEDNRLAKVKAEARKKREEQVRQETLRTKERLARSGRIREHFTDWILDEENEVETHIIHTALKNFKEVLDQLPPDIGKGVNLDAYLKPLNKEKLEVPEFVEYLRNLVTEMTPELFAELMTHMSQCATSYRRAAILEARKEILMELFKACDHASIGIIDRHRVLGLFKAFYDKQAWVNKRHFRNPRRWPVVELDEVGDDESSIAEESNVSSRMSGSVADSRPGTADLSPSTPTEQAKDEGTVEEVDQTKLKSDESVDQPEETAVASKESSEVQQPPTTEEGEEKPQDTTAADGEDGAGQELPEEKKSEEATDAVDKEADEDEEGAKESHPQTAATGRTTAVSFDEEAIATKDKEKKLSLKSPVKTPTSRSGSVAASAFDQNTLNTSQFVALIEVFLGDDPPEEVVQAVIKFIQEGYVETEEEKFSRLQKARREEQLAKRKVMMDQLFDKWDNDGSGFLDLDELHSVMSKFKENMEKKIVAKAKQMLDKEDNDHRLSKTEFKRYLEVVCSLLPGGEDNFDPLVEFLMTSVERSYEERIRGQARKKWLAQIQQAAETSGASMDPVYKSVFNSLYKDSEQHGRGKRISGNIAMLERNDTAPGRGPTCLRYVASTPDDAHFMVNKIMYRDMKGISFTSVDSGKPIHVPRVQNHGNIMFWNPERQEEDRQGSFIVIPLKDHRKRVFGTMGIDTLNDPQEKSIFITHEISFFQGVAKAFSSAFQYVDIRRKTLRIAESAVSWIHRRSPHVQEISVYIVEPDDKEFSSLQGRTTRTRNKKMAKYIEEDVETVKLEDFILRRMLTTDKAGNIETHDHPTKLERKENLFRDYLFRCVDNSETITADAYGHRHTAFPLRDSEGHCVALVDISIGDLKHLPSHENKEVQRMLKLLQYAHKEVSLETEGKEQKVVLEAEKNSEESRIDIMFDRIMLTDLRETVGKLNLRAFAELKSYKDPPKVIHDILASVLSLFYQDKSEVGGELEEYNNCKQYVNQDLIKKIEEFDPTALEAIGAVNRVAARLKEVPHGAVAKHGSLPAQHLYNWAFVCLSLLEHTSKMKMNQKQPLADTPPPGSAMSGGITEQ